MTNDEGLPRYEGPRDAEVVESDRLGRCGKCGMGRITQNGRRICPNCDTKSKTRSNRVVVGSIPSEKDMKKIIHNKGKKDEWTEYLPQKAKGLKVVTREEAMRLSGQDFQIGTELEQLPIATEKYHTEKLLKTYAGSKLVSPPDVVDKLIEDIKEYNVTSIADFKKRDKILKALHKIKEQIESLIKSK